MNLTSFTNDLNMHILFSGDALYPTSDTQTNENDPKGPSFDEKNVYKNRIEFSSPVVCRIVCNIDDPHGHKQPMNLINLINEEMKASPKL